MLCSGYWLEVNSKKITNHSKRSTVVSQFAIRGVEEQQLLKITGHSNIANIMRGSAIIENSNESNVRCVVL